MPENPIEAYMTKAEFCSALGINPRTAERWHLRRIGPPRVRVIKKIYYKRSAVADWMEAQTEGTVSLEARAQGAA